MHTNRNMAREKILIIGAGELGMAVLRQLAKTAAQSSVSVILRPSTINSEAVGKRTHIDELTALGIDILSGDIVRDSVSDLAKQFAGFDTVVTCVGFAAGAGAQVKLAHAAIESGIRRYFPWQFGVDYDVIGRGSAQDLFDEQLDVRDILRSQDQMEWVIVSTGMFTSFLFEPAFGVVDLSRNTVYALGSWETSVTVTTPEDIGLLTTHILFAEPRIANQVVYIAGDTVTYGKLADIVDAVLGRTVSRVEWSVTKLKADLAEDPVDPIKKYRVAFAEGKGVAWDKSTTFNAQEGIAITSVEGWVQQNLK